jgi:hypothetical protein
MNSFYCIKDRSWQISETLSKSVKILIIFLIYGSTEKQKKFRTKTLSVKRKGKEA